MTTIDDLMNSAFRIPRDIRSDEYKAGVRAALIYRLQANAMTIPYSPGTAVFDAYYAGTEEGHAIWRIHQRRSQVIREKNTKASGLSTRRICKAS